MVGRGEVDEDLEEETKEECEKYGKVVKCVIFEVRAKKKMMEKMHRLSRSLTKIRNVFRLQRCPMMKQFGYFWSLSVWSQPSKVSKHTLRPCGSKYKSHFEHPLVALYSDNTSLCRQMNPCHPLIYTNFT